MLARVLYMSTDGGRLTKFKLGTWTEYDNLHRRVIDTQWSQRSNKGQGHQAA